MIGLMAGTSADGVDAAGVRIDGHGEAMRAELLLHVHRPFAPSLRRRLMAAMAPAATRTEEIARLHADLGDAFAEAAGDAVKALGPRRRPTLIGLAGQTVCHLPSSRQGKTVTLQLGEPARIAARTGITTIADFRQSDVAAGGQGAPLVPWTDWLLFRHPTRSRAVQNIGGIGNVTWVPAGARPEDVIAFDTGPGNMVIDALVAHATKGRERMDRDGRRAARGRVLSGVLARWLDHPFLRQPPPRSTGRETFGRAFVERELKRLRAASASADDWIATATAFTAQTIARAYQRYLPGFSVPGAAGGGRPRHGTGRVKKSQSEYIDIILCGGGAANAALAAMLSAALPGRRLLRIDAYGIPYQSKEAISFAILAAARMDGTPANLPRATGAARPALLGTVVMS